MLYKHGHKKCPTCRTFIKTQTINISLRQIIETYVTQERHQKNSPPTPPSPQLPQHLMKSPYDVEHSENLEASLKAYVPQEDIPIVLNYMNDYRRFSIRKIILKKELSETTTEIGSLEHDATLVGNQLNTLENERSLILKDIEMLQQGLSKLNDELSSLKQTSSSIESHSREMKRKESLLNQTVKTVSNAVLKNQMILTNQFNIPKGFLHQFVEDHQ
eukprot:CAMPEP_0117427988 /NCGR_PEP_ID=MMETSP0758-20121206/7770_1 /TAXON_ID=63605 /ORGANISM="Percolomonas cosmopolitus, Strain AE-1 (ATCC 50343)" /LENGTH=216 /DNA_ID=CAMNT_0005214043 /DNA_START=345 /DNA_END=995 /DNA_ORIENTATION=-